MTTFVYGDEGADHRIGYRWRDVLDGDDGNDKVDAATAPT